MRDAGYGWKADGHLVNGGWLEGTDAWFGISVGWMKEARRVGLLRSEAAWALS